MNFIHTQPPFDDSQQTVARFATEVKAPAPHRPASTVAGSSQTRLLALIVAGLALVAGLYFAAPIFLKPAASTENNTPLDPEPDLAALKSKAESGDADARYRLGLAYVKGQGVKEDYTEAAKWYRLAADQGNAAAQNALGELCEAGRGVAQSDADAAKWFRLAAEQGHISAQYSLAVLFAVGKGVTKDDAEAVKWYLKAAERGDSLAQYNIGKRFVEGRGVKQDLAQAFKWLSLAKADGVSDAAAALEQIRTTMTREQMADGKRLLTEFVVLKPTATGK